MINALKELQNTFKYNRLNFDDVICLHITFNDLSNDTNELKFQLKTNYSKENLELLFNNLNFEYDDGFGSQYLFGYIWLTEYRWFERYEYDGAEDWHLKQYPEIPKKLKDV